MSRTVTNRPVPSDSIYLLEILRFIACIGVILYHYQHFVTYRGGVYVPSDIPFHSIFSWFYSNGGSGVQVFWCLSGIVFAHVYQSALINKKIGSLDFVWRRFARLYPLHLATLLFVCLLIWILRTTTDLQNFIYQFNDFKHFMLNMVFANYWGFQEGTSFNGPVWSVSIELIAYFVFLCAALSVQFLPKALKKPLLLLVIWSGIFWVSYSSIDDSSDFILICISLFMVGAIVYTAWHLLPNFVVVLAVAYLIFSHQQTDGVSRSLQVLGVPFTSLMIAVFFLLLGFSRYFGQLSFGRVLAKQLGKITYSMYMIHFPIQFLMVLFSENVISLDFLSPMVFLAFFALTIGLAFLCYDRFEIRAQGFLRSRFQKARSKPSPIAV